MAPVSANLNWDSHLSGPLARDPDVADTGQKHMGRGPCQSNKHSRSLNVNKTPYDGDGESLYGLYSCIFLGGAQVSECCRHAATLRTRGKGEMFIFLSDTIASMQRIQPHESSLPALWSDTAWLQVYHFS